MFQRILVAVDRDPAMAQQVLAEAMAVASTQSAVLKIVHVLYPLRSGYPDPMYMTMDGAFSAVNLQNFEVYVASWEELKKNSQESLNQQVEVAQAAGITAESAQLIGEPGREICSLAQAWEADLIVLGRRGMKGLGEFLLGSVSSYVMHRAPCAVLIVQGESPAPSPAQGDSSAAVPA
ncbi:MAG TPA: universal stress protein [Leptolyngbyaceae cyanobacterium M65_K2018_010]|nr:universal stress protein [Leptolyngbyaceae cyanobacterium M65_K2018_010]